MDQNAPVPEQERTSDKAKTWSEAYEIEKKCIRERRKVAFELTDEKGDSSEINQLSGLALSGGGIRSALFNDGFIQALSHKGLLRYLDYFCSVSGGGYIGGHLISCGVQKKKQADAQHIDENYGAESVSFHDDENYWHLGKDPQSGRMADSRLSGVGGYLKRTHLFFARYFSSQIFSFMVYFGVAGILATTLAMIWRSFDQEDFRLLWRHYNLNEWGGEVSLAFYPTIWILLIWALLALIRLPTIIPAIARFFEREGKLTAGIFLKCMMIANVLLLISLMVGFAVLIGNGITNAATQNEGNHIQLNRFAEILAVCAGVLQLMVFFGRDKLFRSEQAEAANWKRMLNRVLSAAVAALLFFSMVHWMSREDLSGYTQHRDPHIVRQEVLDWQMLTRLSVLNPVNDKSRKDLVAQMRAHDQSLYAVEPASSWKKFRPNAQSPTPESTLEPKGSERKATLN
ncbi:MAG: hypothetical protein AAGA30_18065, partial [Planctomycetota bacterium]